MALRPKRYRDAVVPHIYIEGANAAIDFYKEAFGASEILQIAKPNGRILHAELTICGSTVMLGDPDDHLYGEPRKVGRCTAGLHLLVDDNASVMARAVQAGCKVIQEPVRCFTARIPRVCEIRTAMFGCFSLGKRTSLLARWNVAPRRRSRDRGLTVPAARVITGSRDLTAASETEAAGGGDMKRKLIEATLVSLDGVFEGQEKWSSGYFDEEAKAQAYEALANVDTFLLGRATSKSFPPSGQTSRATAISTASTA